MIKSGSSIFTGMQILHENEWLRNHALIVRDGKIQSVLAANLIKDTSSATVYEFPGDYYLSPGFIDLHIHGAQGFDVMDGSLDALTGISEALAAEGVTGFLATTMTAESSRISAVLKTIAKAMPGHKGAAILGAHLEGPFISPDKMGAQLADEISQPDPDLLAAWQGMAKGAIKLLTLAPELANAMALIKKSREMNIIASIGHTNATYAETNIAIKTGCSHATHLFNAMRGIHQREPGAVGALMLADNINAELIVDGLHLHPAIVEMVLRLKGKDKILLVTDAMRAKCLGDGQYDLGGQSVSVRSSVATLSDGTLAGSTLRMPQAVKNMVQFTKCSLADAIYMASLNPARRLGLSGRKGSIAVGKDADLVILNPSFEIIMTMRNGVPVYA